MGKNEPITIDRSTRIQLPEMPGVTYVMVGLWFKRNEPDEMTAEIHLVEENEWRRRRVANGLPVDRLTPPPVAPGE